MEPLEPNARLVERIDATDSLAIFRVAPAAGVPAFEPGQFTNLGLPGESRLRRAFSIASPPAQRELVELYVRRVDEGEFTPRLWELEPGAPVWLDPRVYGRFTLEEIPRESDLLMVGTGTGIAPFLSMVRAYRGSGRWRRCVLIESARSAEELAYRAELERSAAEDPSFQYLPTLTREPPSSAWTGLRGRVQAVLEPAAFERATGAALVRPEGAARWQVLLCGNPAMIGSVTELLVPHGFRPHRRREPGEIHAERYW